MSKRRNFIRKKLLDFFIIGGIASSFYVGSKVVANTEKIAEVPLNVRNDLYYNGILEDYPYLQTYGNYTSKGEHITRATDTDYLVDKYVTYKSLKKLKSLEIHMQNVSNLKFLKKCPNIEELYICESELLSDEDIKIINKSNIKKVYLTFEPDNIRKVKEEKFDISKIKKEIVINNCFYSDISDMDQIVFYNYLDNYRNEMFADQKSLELINNINEYLDNVIKEYKIDEGKDDKEKIILIANYICNSIEYDNRVSDQVTEYQEKRENDEHLYFRADDRIKNYNYHAITSIINQEKQKKRGVCVNYASLFDVLCYKVGIKCRIVDGIDSNSKLGHAWNLVYLDEGKEYVDLTSFDDSLNEQHLKDYYNNKNIFSYQLIDTQLFMNTETNYKSFSLFEELDELDTQNEKDRIYRVNEGLDGFYMINDDLSLKPYFIIFITGGVIGIAFKDKFKKSKKIKKLLELK